MMIVFSYYLLLMLMGWCLKLILLSSRLGLNLCQILPLTQILLSSCGSWFLVVLRHTPSTDLLLVEFHLLALDLEGWLLMAFLEGVCWGGMLQQVAIIGCLLLLLRAGWIKLWLLRDVVGKLLLGVVQMGTARVVDVLLTRWVLVRSLGWGDHSLPHFLI